MSSRKSKRNMMGWGRITQIVYVFMAMMLILGV